MTEEKKNDPFFFLHVLIIYLKKTVKKELHAKKNSRRFKHLVVNFIFHVVENRER
jgi:hypothetical protein